jgi:hypothetical protein
MHRFLKAGTQFGVLYALSNPLYLRIKCYAVCSKTATAKVDLSEPEQE